MDYNTEDELSDYIKGDYEVSDRFSFDYLFKKLLKDGYDNEEAKNIIVFNCALSSLVIQERIDNGYYLKIKEDDDVAPDLLDLYREAFNKISAYSN
jgi:hypothetical protein